MALHYKLKLLLWLNSLQKNPPVNELPPAEARKLQLETTKKLVALTEFKPAPMHKVTDTFVPTSEGSIPVRIYQPLARANQPVLMFFHGGGFVLGSVEIYEGLCRRLAYLSQCVVISVDYRLAPEHKFPAAPQDCYAATVWASQNAHLFGGDASRLAVCGDSAGGNLATVVAMMARDQKGPHISYQVLLYPTVDASFRFASIDALAEGYLLTKPMMVWFLDHYRAANTDPKDPYFSPFEATDLSGLPPALIITAEYDPLRDEGRAYAERLEAAGVPVKYREYKGMIHVFMQMPKFLKKGREAQAWVAAELRTYFGIDGLVQNPEPALAQA